VIEETRPEPPKLSDNVFYFLETTFHANLWELLYGKEEISFPHEFWREKYLNVIRN